MARQLLFGVFAIAAAQVTQAQVSVISLSDAHSMRMMSLGADERLLVTERRFGFDSSHVEVLEADPSWNVTPLAARRFTDWLWFFFDAAPAPGGMVVTGTLTSSYAPQLHMVNTDGSLAWARSFSGMTSSQTRIAMLFGDGAAHYGYTNSDGFFGNRIYRVDGEETGTTFSIRSTTVPDVIFRMYVGAPAASPEDHVIGGSGIESGASDYDALLGHFSTDGCAWLKQIELGGAGPGIEEVAGVVRMSGGGHAVAMHTSGTPASGFLMRIDDNGALLNCTRIEDPAGVYIGDITQLYDGTFLLSGSTAGGIGTMYKLTGTGSLIWSRQCAGCAYNTTGSFYQDPFGDLYGLASGTILEVSPDGDACGFTDVASTTVSSFTPTITDLTVVNDLAPPVTVNSMSMFERAPAGSSSVVCGAIGMNDAAGGDPLVAYPVPTEDVVWLGSAGQVADGERLEVRDPAGRLVRRAAYADGLDLRGLGSGIYLVTAPLTHMRAVVQKR